MFRTLTFTALIAYASAQSLSQQCTSTLTAIAGNPDAASCLSPTSLLPLLTGGSNNSVVPTINTWLTSICGAPACSNDTLAAVVKNATEGCSTELSAFGFNSNLTPSITGLVQQYYPTVRKVVCLKDGDNNCIVKTLGDVESTFGPLSLQNIVKLVANPPNDLPANITCTNCIKAAYTVVAQDIPALVSDTAPALQQQCGADFTDGQTPTGISQSANTNAASSSPPPSNGAALSTFASTNSGLVGGLAASGFVAVATFFSLLA
ncbi:hypothetical protein BJ165DRAFT_1525147 [Panaeolus papilionaceus]|nr:hypothetical protein BJ165DRAFT_1525147 [Panaeolus papilionaceus]